jgi:hypothetical protein
LKIVVVLFFLKKKPIMTIVFIIFLCLSIASFCFADCVDGAAMKVVPTGDLGTGEAVEFKLDLSKVLANAIIRVHMIQNDADALKVEAKFRGPADLKVAIVDGATARTVGIDASSATAQSASPVPSAAPGVSTTATGKQTTIF